MEDEAVKAALDGLWERFLPQMMDRAGVLESAVAAVKAGRLGTEERAAAGAAAHALAGVLGTFGLDKGTELARELERIYNGGGELVEAEVSGQTGQLRALIEGR